MKNLLLLLLLNSCLSCQKEPYKYDIVIEDITIIDTENSRLLPHQTIFIKQDRIDKILATSIDTAIIADSVIDGTGKYILPGFWDMHVHTCWKEDLDKKVFPVFLQFGITGIRDMGGNLEILNTFKENSIIQPHSYPNLFGAGPILDGKKPIHPAFSVPVTRENYKSILDSLRNLHIDFFKVYSLLKEDVLDSIASYSKQNNISFSGHISENITPEKASQMGYRSFEHLNRIEELAVDSIRLSKFVESVKKNKNWICPTLILYQRKFQIDKGEFFYHSLFEDLDQDLKMEWNILKQRTVAKEEDDLINSNNRFIRQKELVKTLYDNQIPLLLGTDFAGMQFIYPGYSYHEEMQLMQDLGIPQYDILKMATLNPAIYLDVTELYGTVEKNKIADLIILNENPIENIVNTLTIDMVIKSGTIVK